MSTLNCRRSHRRSLPELSLLAAALLLPTACAEAVDGGALGTQTQAIYYGTRTPTVVSLSAGEQLAIGYLAGPGGTPFCSGTLIDRDVVVTAQHCTDGSSASEIRFGVGHPSDPDGFFAVQSIREHQSRDVALLFLSEDAVSRVPAIEPLPFLREALGSQRIGGRVEAAGYGETHDGSDGRYFAALELIDIDDEFYTVDGNGQRGICFGDSGGPLRVDDGGYTLVAGVESNGDSTCVDVDHLTRLDRVASWIDGENGGFDPNAGPSTGGGGGGKPPVVNAPTPGGTPTSTPPSSGPSSTPRDDSGSDDDYDFDDVFAGCSATGRPAAAGAWTVLAAVGLVASSGRRRRS